MKLKEIGIKYGTDKSGIHGTHIFNDKCFLDNYEPYLSKYLDRNINLLEIGIFNGSSLKMWSEYFPSANIIGLDIDPMCKQFQSNNIKVYIGSQSDENLFDNIIEDNGLLDIIIDDGSHVNDLTIKTFNILFKNLVSGGIYIIEDTHCTYEAALINWPGMTYNSKEINLNNKRENMNELLFKLIDDLDHKKGDIFSISFYSETLVITKK